ncbi:MAG: ROK family protein [Phycisphaerales bacterium]|nr:ROK family protein [Phycisphaerales bacterium]
MRIGIDLGGTKIEGIALDHAGAELLRHRVPTPAAHYDSILAEIKNLVLYLENHLGSADSVGVGSPGAISAVTGLLKNSNTVCLNGKPLDVDLEKILDRKIQLANDANCFALSESIDGAAAGARCVFGVILGTGVGGAICIDQKPVVGANSIAGEWGHNPMPWPTSQETPGPDCYCGRQGCLETFLSGKGMTQDYVSLGGAPLDAAEIYLRAEAGEPLAQKSVHHYEERLAKAIATVVNILDPDVVVLGGGLSNMTRLYNRIPELWGQWIFSDAIATRLVKNQHGDSSGVRGAAMLQ